MFFVRFGDRVSNFGSYVAWFFVLSISIGFVSVRAQPFEYECDKLASSPVDPDRVNEGVPFEELNASLAIPACEKAVRDHPSIARLRFQLARGLQKSERYPEAALEYQRLAAGGHIAAAHNLANLLLAGTGVSKDSKGAIDLFRQAAEGGLSLSQFQLGLLYAQGQHVERNLPVAAEWYARAAHQGHIASINNLADMYAKGHGLAQDYAEAAKWYAVAAAKGNALAQDKLGDLYKNGTGVPRDHRKALELYRASAAQGYAVAQADVGLMYANGLGVAQDYAEAAKWYAAAAAQGNAWAQDKLGDLYKDGTGVPRDYQKALELYRASAAQGYAVAQADVGLMYANGLGVVQDYAEAAKWYAAAAAQGNAWAQNALGRLYQDGTGAAQDYLKAVELYQKAATNGHASAYASLGWMYYNGLGVPLNYTEAARWYRMAAEKDVIWAQNTLAWLYRAGQGVERDYEEALRWSRRSAALGSDVGLYDVGWDYENGRGIERDETEAERWYERAAQKGHVAAQERLGILFTRGLELAPNPRKTLKESQEKLNRKLAEPFNGSPADYEIELQNYVRDFLDAEYRLNRSAYGRTRPQEAVKWFRKAIEGGSGSASVRLANILLAPGDLTTKALKGEAPIRPDAGEAARLYALAAEKGIVAAMFNLGALYEVGSGVPRSLEKAGKLYHEARKLAPERASLALLRVEMEDRWAQFLERRSRLVFNDDDRPPQTARLSKVMITSRSNGAREDGLGGLGIEITIHDEWGRRLLHGHLKENQSIVVPEHSTPVILSFPFGTRESYVHQVISVSVDGKAVAIPEHLRAIGGIYLDPNTLLSGGNSHYDSDTDNYDYEPAFLPKSTWRGSRVVVYALREGELFVRDDQHLIGFKSDRETTYIPNAPGMKLEVSNKSYQKEGSAKYEIHLDGRKTLTVQMKGNCTVTVDVEPHRLLHAPADTYEVECESAREPTHGVVSTTPDGLPLIWITERQEDALGSGITILRHHLAGNLKEERNALERALTSDLRAHGPNSSSISRSLISLAQIELSDGNYRAARDKIERAAAILEHFDGEGISNVLSPYRAFADALRKADRLADAERFALKAYYRGLRTMALTPTYDAINELSSLAALYWSLEEREGAALLLLQESALKQLIAPEGPDLSPTSGGFPSLGSTEYLRLAQKLRDDGRDELARQVSILFHRVAKNNIGIDAISEPLQHPIDLSGFEWYLGPIDQSSVAASSFESLASAYQALNRHDEALPLLIRALDIRKRVFGATHISVAETLRKLTDTHLALKNYNEAVAHVREARAIVVGSDPDAYRADRRALGSDFDRSVIASTYARVADLAAKNLPNQRAELVAEAFEIAQLVGHSRAAEAVRKAGERLADASIDLRRLLRERQDLEERINAADTRLLLLASKLAGDRDRTAEEQVRQDLAQLERTLATTEREVRVRFPEYASVTQTRKINIQETRRTLAPDELLLYFLLGEQSSFVFAVSREQIHLRLIGLGEQKIGQMVFALRCGLDVDLWLDSDQAEACRKKLGRQPPTLTELNLPFNLKISYDLYSSLLGPVEDLLSKKQLIIIPSGPLTSLPFQVLVKKRSIDHYVANVVQYRKVTWLGVSHPITVLPSVASLKTLRRNAMSLRERLPFVGFGNPLLVGRDGKDQSAFDATSCMTAPKVQIAHTSSARATSVFRGGFPDLEAVRRLAPLPDSASELCAVADALHAAADKIFLGQRATESVVKDLSARGNLMQYQVLHFATHGVTAGEFDGSAEPALVLTPPISASERDDGLLTSSEIAQLHLDADWVILSACNTAAGERLGAEALSGLVRAFFYAGARSLLVSHWPVASAAAVKLTTGIFSSIESAKMAGRPITQSVALQRSMIALLQRDRPQSAHPAIWAPFVVIGLGGRGRWAD